MNWLDAADAADDLLAVQAPGLKVSRELEAVYANAEVFAFTRIPEPVDDQLLVVDRATGEARLVSAPPWTAHPFPGLVPLDELTEGDAL